METQNQPGVVLDIFEEKVLQGILLHNQNKNLEEHNVIREKLRTMTLNEYAAILVTRDRDRMSSRAGDARLDVAELYSDFARQFENMENPTFTLFGTPGATLWVPNGIFRDYVTRESRTRQVATLSQVVSSNF